MRPLFQTFIALWAVSPSANVRSVGHTLPKRTTLLQSRNSPCQNPGPSQSQQCSFRSLHTERSISQVSGDSNLSVWRRSYATSRRSTQTPRKGSPQSAELKRPRLRDRAPKGDEPFSRTSNWEYIAKDQDRTEVIGRSPATIAQRLALGRILTFVTLGNVVIYILWKYADRKERRTGDPSFRQWMETRFTFRTLSPTERSTDSILAPVLSIFSHRDIVSLAVNLVGLFAMSHIFLRRMVLRGVTNSRFSLRRLASTYFLGGGFAFAASELSYGYQAQRIQGSSETRRVSGGAGAFFSLFGACCTLSPPPMHLVSPGVVRLEFSILLIPVSIFEILWYRYRPDSSYDSAAHLGGLVIGILLGLRYKRRIRLGNK